MLPLRGTSFELFFFFFFFTSFVLLVQVSKEPFNCLVARSYLISQRFGGVYDWLSSLICVGVVTVYFAVYFSILMVH